MAWGTCWVSPSSGHPLGRLDEQRSQHPMVADIAVDQCGTRHVATEKAVIRTTFALGHVVADVPAWHLKMSVED